MDELVLVSQQLAIQILLHEAQDVLEKGVQWLLVGTDGRHPELRPLQEILVAHLGRGDLELVADPGLEAA